MNLQSRYGANVGALIRRAALIHPDRQAVIQGDRCLSFAEVEKRSDALAAGLLGLGLKPGERVLMMAPNGIEIFESIWAVWKAGLVWVPLHERLSPREVDYAAQLSGARAFLHHVSFAGHAQAAQAASPALLHLIGFGAGGQNAYDAMVETHLGTHVEIANVDALDPCWMFFTSGSTGRPKGALFGHGHLAAVVNNFLADVLPGLGDGDMHLVCAPLSHGAGVQMLANAGHCVGSVLTQSRRLDPDEVWGLVERHRITNIFTVPTLLKMLVEHPAVDRHDHRSLRYVTYSGSPMYREDQKLAIAKLGRVIVQLYGLAEVTTGITVLPREWHDEDDNVHPVGSCGYARTGMEISVRGEDDRELPLGQTGEICARGPNVFLGYHENPEANARSFRGGWFHTGDLGHLDTRGLLFISGRNSDMLISGGQNIYPREIEELLLTHPAIHQAAVVGMPDAKWGEIPVAALVLETGAAIDADAVLAFLEGKLAKYKWPRKVVFCTELPVSEYGKVTKPALREMLQARLPDA